LAQLRLFAAAREAAGTGRDTVDGETVGEVLAAARLRYGARFGEVLEASRVWLNGEPAHPSSPVGAGDEVAVLPPVSGGATAQKHTRKGAHKDVPRGAHRPRRRAARKLGLAPPLDDGAPYGRLGLAWFAITVPVLVAGPRWLAAWLALHAAVAGAQMAMSWRRAGPRVVAPAAALGAVIATAGFVAGTAVGIAGLVGGALLSAAAAGLVRAGRGRSPARGPAVVCALVPGLAAGSLLAARTSGAAAGLALLLVVCTWDGANYIMGTEARWRWTGPAAAALAVGVVTLAAAAAGSPPVTGATAWVLGGAAVLLTPIGPRLATLACGDRTANLSALRRLDGLLLTGPAWWVLVHVLPGR